MQGFGGVWGLAGFRAALALVDLALHRALRRPTNGRPGFPFGFLGAGGRLPKARRGRVSIAQLITIMVLVDEGLGIPAD